MTNNIILQPAMKGLIVNSGKILILQEAKTYKEGTQVGRWHMPGGRVNPGEHFVDGLRREIKEETGITSLEIGMPIYIGEWRPTIRAKQHQIIANFIVVSTKQWKVRLSDEHSDFKWIKPQEHVLYDLMDPEDKVIERFIELETNGLIF